MRRPVRWLVVCESAAVLTIAHMLTTVSLALAVVLQAATPVIQSADAAGGKVFITGTEFGTSRSPVVTIGGSPAVVLSYARTTIVTVLPSSVRSGSYAV